MAQQPYEPGFLWGAAVSAHQVEGAFDGGENGDWYEFEHSGNHILNGDTADIATDQWHRYAEDFELAKAMGLNSIRTSIAWEKVEPAEGTFSEDAIAHYRDVLQAMRDAGLQPMVTLLHGTSPLWFQSQGGWTSGASPRQFLAYAEFVVTRLADLCDLWATLNEPMVLVGDGYLDGTIPPQMSSPETALHAGANIVRGHRLVTARIHELQPVTAGWPMRGVGLVNSLDLYDPHDSWNPLDLAVTAIVTELSNWTLLKAAIDGQLELDRLVSMLRALRLDKSPEEIGNIFQNLTPAEAESGNPMLDWIGVNYYTRSLIQFNWTGRPNMIVPDGLKGDNGWAIYPEGLERILRDTAERFPKIPIIVSENGMADARDQYRPQLIRDSLAFLDRAKFGADGKPRIDVRGYYHWSLTDNFEWEFGYAHRFGVVEIQYDEGLERVPRPSANVYRQELLSRLKTQNQSKTEPAAPPSPPAAA